MSGVRLPWVTSLIRSPGGRRALLIAPAAFVVLAGLAWGILSLTWPDHTVHMHVRWASGVTDAQRSDLERRFHLTQGTRSEGLTWEYQLADASTANIRAIVQNEQVADTAHLNRLRYRPEFSQDRLRHIVAYSLVVGGAGALVLLLFAAGSIRVGSPRLTWWSAIASTVRTPSDSTTRERVARPGSRIAGRATAAAVVVGIVTAAAMVSLAGARPLSAAGALAVLYGFGYVAGSLLVGRVDAELDLSLATIRTIAGLLLSTVAFLLSLVLSLPWFVGPVALVASTVSVRGARALVLPHVSLRVRWDGAAAGLLAAILLAPIALTYGYMAPGNFPPVFYNIDTAYTLEKVHAFVAADRYPPDSLSNVGVRRTYHYGSQAMAALISRSSGLLPHHALFLIVLPLLTAGVVAAAVAAARFLSTALPRSVTVPFLLLSIPSLTNPFWSRVGARLWSPENSAVWGILSNEGPNVGSDALILGSIAGIAAAASWGWVLPAFLIGAAILVKTTAGIALFSGFALAETWRAVRAKQLTSPQLVIAGAVFAATAVFFFVISFENNFRMEWSPLYYLREMAARGNLVWTGLDVFWLLLPAIIVLSAGIGDPDRRSTGFLLMGIAPLIVVNATRLDSIVLGGGGTGDDWFQTLHAVPFLLHAFVLSIVGCRWSQLGHGRRTAVLLAMVLAIAPVTVAAARYSLQLLEHPESGNDFVDNRSLAAALAVVPTTGTIVVTNDLRYPAGNFTRDYRQMQIPALFGHQAFAVNYAHEAVEERRGLQQLLQRAEWSGAIVDASRKYGWTHLLIRKDYVHPTPIPLERIFENESYEVFRFR